MCWHGCVPVRAYMRRRIHAHAHARAKKARFFLPTLGLVETRFLAFEKFTKKKKQKEKSAAAGIPNHPDLPTAFPTGLRLPVRPQDSPHHKGVENPDGRPWKRPWTNPTLLSDGLRPPIQHPANRYKLLTPARFLKREIFYFFATKIQPLF